MGIRGLFTYVNEHLRDVLVKHKLHHCKVVIDGNNLEHILYNECSGINSAFGGDYDKFSSFVEEFFKGLLECHIVPIVIMDGGQPLDNKKMNTVRERITNQIQTCLAIHPSNQYRLKVFPCMGRDVFVSTLKRMGIFVLQADFEADMEIAILAKEFGLTILSNDSDFFMFGVSFVLLSSITYNKVSTGKKKRSKEMFSYISCHRFSEEKFCQVTGVAPEHFPIFATLLGNDYLPFDHFKGFYSSLDKGNRGSRMTYRHYTIKNVLEWLSRQKGKTPEQLISIVERFCVGGRSLRRKMRATMKNYYTDCHSNLIRLVSEYFVKTASHNLLQANLLCKENSQPTDDILQHSNLGEIPEVETELFCNNGKKLPPWFVSAFRELRISHEVADIVTKRYFISRPQVEEKPSLSCYLLVEPIVRTIYTMLWHSSYTDCKYLSRGSGECAVLSEGNVYGCATKKFLPQSQTVPESLSASDVYDSDVIVEEDIEEDQDNVFREEDFEMPMKDAELQVKGNDSNRLMNKKIEINEPTNNDRVSKKEKRKDFFSKLVTDNTTTEGNHHNESDKNEEMGDTVLEAETDDAKKGYLKWYLRRGSCIWVKNVSYLPTLQAKTLPSLAEVETLSLQEKRNVFYSVFEGNTQSTSLDIPDDLELILDFIIFWYQRSSSSLLDIHVLSALLCVFMFYIIDGKVGRIRTRKAFEDEEKWKSQYSKLKSDAAYCRSDGVKNTLAQVSNEECFLAAKRLFRFHHMDETVSDKYYSRKTVHAFSEYQACIYFVQILNSLLGFPFPFLSVDHLWGGTFCYNIYFCLKKKSNCLVKVSEFLGKGSCLEKLFYMLFARLSEILNFEKHLGILKLLEIPKLSPKNINPDENDKVTMSNTEDDVPQKKKKKRKPREKRKKDCTEERRNSTEAESSDEEIETEKIELLDNRFSALLLNT